MTPSDELRDRHSSDRHCIDRHSSDRHSIDRLGRPVLLREPTAEDVADLIGLADELSDHSLYLRFFSSSRSPAEHYLAGLAEPHPHRFTLLAEQCGGLAGVVSVNALAGSGAAELSLLAAEGHHHEGLGTLLLEAAIDVARRRGLTRLVADVLSQNAPMHQVVKDLGLHLRSSIEFGVDTITIDLTPTQEYLDRHAERERTAVAASLRPLLRPASVAVIGAGHRPGSVGHELLRNLLIAGFPGDLYVVNPHRSEVLGLPCRASVAELPETVELAVIAVPADEVGPTLDLCGRAGMRAAVVVSSGFSETSAAGGQAQRELATTARRYGMRLLGPNCLGVLNTDPAARLNATFAPISTEPGPLALISQSGAFGIGFANAGQRAGLGLAQFVSIGNKADVSATDLLLADQDDPRIEVVALYLESLLEPRRLRRVARRFTEHKPILAVKSGRSGSGRRAGASHTAAAATDDVLVEALLEECGIVRVDGEQALLDAARVLALQPAPAGPRVAIVGNSGGPEILVADAAESAGLSVPTLSEQLQERIRHHCPAAAGTTNPIDLGAGVQPASLCGIVATLLHTSEVDAVIAVLTETLVADAVSLRRAVARARDRVDGPRPVILVCPGQVDAVEQVSSGSIPVFAFGEAAAAALGRAWSSVRLARENRSVDADLPGALAEQTQLIDLGRRVDTLIDGTPAGWLPAAGAAELLRLAGIDVIAHRISADPAELAKAAAGLGYPVCLKPAAGPVHKSDRGLVITAIADEAGLRRAVADLRDAGGTGELLLQAMAEPGLELIVGGMSADRFGPLVMFGLGGVGTDIDPDRQYALAPASAARVSELLGRLRHAPLLEGFRSSPGVDRSALIDLVVRLSRLLAASRRIAEIDLNPVICTGSRLQIVDAKIRLSGTEEERS